MRLYDFLHMINLEGFNLNELIGIIPIKGKDTVNMGESIIDEEKKINIDSSEYAIENEELYEGYDIHPKIINFDKEYGTGDVEIKFSKDGYRYIEDNNGDYYVILT